MNQSDERTAQYRIITSQLLDRGSDVSATLASAQKAGEAACDLCTLSLALESLSNAVLDTIRLDLALDRPRKPHPRIMARRIAAICHELEKATALLPGVPEAPPHADTTALRARAHRLAATPPKRSATILPFRTAKS